MKNLKLIPFFILIFLSSTYAQKLSLSISGGPNINYSNENHPRLLPFQVHSSLGGQYGLALAYQPFKKYDFSLNAGVDIFHATNKYSFSYLDDASLDYGQKGVTVPFNYTASSFNFSLGYVFWKRNRINAQMKIGVNLLSLNTDLYNAYEKRDILGSQIYESLNGARTIDYQTGIYAYDDTAIAATVKLGMSYKITPKINFFTEIGTQLGIANMLCMTNFQYRIKLNSTGHYEDTVQLFITSKGDAILMNMGFTFALTK